MATKECLEAENKLLHALLKCQADIIKRQKAEMQSIKTMIIEALAV